MGDQKANLEWCKPGAPHAKVAVFIASSAFL
jgi:hypothetical protein